MKLYILRHGETIYNKEGTVQGWRDSALTDFGREQAAHAGAELAKLKPTTIFASDLGRVQQTLAEVKKHVGDVPVLLDWRLRERNFGEAEGKQKTDFNADDLRGLTEHPQVKGLEPMDVFTERVIHFISDLLDFAKDDEGVAIITHNGVINRFAFLTDEASYEWTEYTNGDILELELKSGD